MRSPPRNLYDERGFTVVEVAVAMVLLVIGLFAVLTMVDFANQSAARTGARDTANNVAREVLERARQVPYADLNTADATSKLSALVPDSTVSGGTWTVRRRNVNYTVAATACKVDDPTDGISPVNSKFCAPAPGDNNNGYPPGSTALLSLLGLDITLSGSLVQTICNLLNPSPSTSSQLDTLLGRNGLLGTLTGRGASVSVCTNDAGQDKGQIALDPNPDDFNRVSTTIGWTSGNRSSTVTQSTIIDNPGVDGP